jgi:D-3-phosphoglycerate dehydrogenase
MKVYNAEPYGYSGKAIDLWKEKGYVYQAGSWEEIDRTETFPDVTILIVRLKRKVDKEVLAKFPNLKDLVSATTGWDHLDTGELEKRKIRLLSLRGHDEFLKTIPSTAEHTWALLMALIRNIPKADENVQAGIWNRDQFRGFELKGKTIGIIGYGRTGQRVARYANAFEMKVLFYDPFIENGAEGHVKVVSLENLLRKSDVITLHVHLNKDTEFLLNADNVSQIKKGAYLLNTSRGKVWDEACVVKSLENEHIAGVATDVLQTELVNITESPLWLAKHESKNIIITPHIGGATWDAMWACEEYIIQRL